MSSLGGPTLKKKFKQTIQQGLGFQQNIKTYIDFTLDLLFVKNDESTYATDSNMKLIFPHLKWLFILSQCSHKNYNTKYFRKIKYIFLGQSCFNCID